MYIDYNDGYKVDENINKVDENILSQDMVLCPSMIYNFMWTFFTYFTSIKRRSIHTLFIFA